MVGCERKKKVKRHARSRDKIITVRVDEEMYEAIKKRAARANQAVSEHIFKLIESSFDENARLDLLIQQIHDDVLSLMDMSSLMQGFNSEVFVTLLARTSKDLDAEGRKEMQLQRDKAIEGLNGYKAKVSKRLMEGESVWTLFTGKD